MPAASVRTYIWTAVALFAVGLAVAIILPLVASTQLVRARIAQELSERSGYRVVIGTAPELRLWPTLKAVLRDVSFRDWGDNNARPFISADRLEADVSVWTALTGGAELSAVTMRRPVIALPISDGAPYLPASTGSSRLQRAIENARAGNKVGDEPALGFVRLVDGRIVDAADGEDVVTKLNANMDWSTLDSSAKLNANGEWRGAPIALTFYAQSPLALAIGQASDVQFSVKSDPLTAEFEGKVTPGAGLTIEGALSASTPSLGNTLAWAGMDIGPARKVEAVSISGNASGTLANLKLSDATIQFEEFPGSGALEVSMTSGVPQISGTLAFDKIDLDSFLDSFSDDASGKSAINLDFTNQFGLDLRLSAAQTSGGGVTLGDVAATAQVRKDFVAFDISDSKAFGGTLQLGYRADRRQQGDTAELRLSGTDIDWRALTELGGWQGIGPRGKGSVSAALTGPVTDWSSFPRKMSGTVTGRLGKGSIEGVDISKLLDRPPADGFFALASVAGGAVPIQEADFKATITSGIARLESMRAQTETDRIALSGIIALTDRSLALSGSVTTRVAEGQPPASPRHFFVGGSWIAPFLSPLPLEFQP